LAKNYENDLRVDKVIAMKRFFLAHPAYLHQFTLGRLDSVSKPFYDWRSGLQPTQYISSFWAGWWGSELQTDGDVYTHIFLFTV